MTEDAALMRRFVANGDEEAFGGLVSRHFGLVYGTALRLANGDAGLAEEVTQMVFTDLARKAKLLPRGVVLAGWLHQAARFAAAKAIRGEERRRRREQEAVAMMDDRNESSLEWERLRPALDAALSRLSARDRDAVLLRYFEQKTFDVVGAALGVSSDTAQKRVSRALGKLRAVLARGGVTVSGDTLAQFLAAGILPRAADGLALSVAKTSLAKAATLGPPGAVGMALERLLAAKAGFAVAGLLVLLLGGTVAFLAKAAHPVDLSAFVTVDLSAHYNGRLDKSWTPDYTDNHLASLGAGRRVLNRVPFNVGGVVQLQGGEWERRGYQFPQRVQGIQVGTSARRIHLLHANSAFADVPGTTVASLVVHYANSEQAQFDLRQGIELLDWWGWPAAPIKKPTGADTVVAWTGDNPAARQQGARIRLFDTVWENPSPEKQIDTIDYVSAMARSAPFIVGLTVEH
jgi:RNA polymerase sigma factor (sigma-70 family)